MASTSVDVVEIWRYQGGISKSSGSIFGVTAATDNSVYLAGMQYAAGASTYDFAAVKLDADGDLLWDWQEQAEDGNSSLNFAAVVDDGVVMSGYFESAWNGMLSSGNFDFAAVKLYSNGTVAWRWQEGSTENDFLLEIAKTTDGNVVVAGGTDGSWNDIMDGWHDITAAKLNVDDGEVIWRYQAGTTNYRGVQAYAVAARGDGSVVLGGYTSGSFASTFTGDEETSDFLAVALDEDGNELWRWQDGPGTGINAVIGVAAFDDGSVLLAGYTEGSWYGVNSGGRDFAVTKLSASGEMEWKWQSGTATDDAFYGAAIGIDGSVVISGYTSGSWAATHQGGWDFVAMSMDADKNMMWEYQAGTTSNDMFHDAAVRPDGLIVLAGWTYGIWNGSGTSNGYAEFAAVLLDTDMQTPYVTPSPTSSVTPAPTPSPMPLPTPSPTPYPTPSSMSIPTPSPTPYPTPSPMFFPTPSPTPFPTPSPMSIPAPSPTPYPTPSPMSIPTPSPTHSPTPFPTPSPLPLLTPSPTPYPSPSPVPYLSTPGTAPTTRGIAPSGPPSSSPSPESVLDAPMNTIIGASVGGVVLMIAIVMTSWFCWYRRRRGPPDPPVSIVAPSVAVPVATSLTPNDENSHETVATPLTYPRPPPPYSGS